MYLLQRRNYSFLALFFGNKHNNNVNYGDRITALQRLTIFQHHIEELEFSKIFFNKMALYATHVVQRFAHSFIIVFQCLLSQLLFTELRFDTVKLYMWAALVDRCYTTIQKRFRRLNIIFFALLLKQGPKLLEMYSKISLIR